MENVMADSTPSSHHTSDIAQKSYFQQTVCLYDWWLVKAENDFHGKRLAVGGITARTGEAKREFVSTAIVKMYDPFSLETADGIYIIFKGFINQQRTIQNGFSPQVFDSFLFGFPLDWESHAVNCLREETIIGIDSGSVEKSSPTSLVPQEKATGDHKKQFPEDECNVSKRCSARLQKKVPNSGGPPNYPDKEQNSTLGALENLDGEELNSPVTPIQPWSPEQVNALYKQLLRKSACRISRTFSGVGKSSPTSLVSSEKASVDHQKPFPECNVSKKMHGVNAAYSNYRIRHSARLHNIKVCQQKMPVSGGPLNHSEKEQSPISGPMGNLDTLDLKSPVTPVQPWSQEQENISSDQLFRNSTSRISGTLPANTEDECNASKEMLGVKTAYGNDGNRRSARLHNINVCLKKIPVSGGNPNHSKKEQTSALGTLDNPHGQELNSPVTPVQPRSQKQENMSSEQLFRKSTSRISQTLPANTEDERNASTEMLVVKTAYGNDGSRRSARLHNINVCPKIPVSGGNPNHSEKEQTSALGTLDNPHGQELNSPVTPVQPPSQEQENTSLVQLVRKSASRISRTLPVNPEGCYRKKRMTDKAKVISCERKMTKSASAVKYPRDSRASPLMKEGKEKLSLVSPESLSLRKSRSGRLLLPPLEFWRNQIPVYNADHEITEIQGGASLVSLHKDSSPSLSRKRGRPPRKQRQ